MNGFDLAWSETRITAKQMGYKVTLSIADFPSYNRIIPLWESFPVVGIRLLYLAALFCAVQPAWFPRVAEIRAEAERIVGYSQVSTWEPPQDLLRAQFYHLEQQFFNKHIPDEETWLNLVESFANRDRPCVAADTR